MKSGIIAVLLASIVVIGGIAYAFHRTDDSSIEKAVAVTAETHELAGVVHVDDLAKKPEDFKGEFVLRGVVAGVRKIDGIFAVIDSREFKTCGVLTCAINTIPVKFDGELPGSKTIVEITGRVVQSEKGLIISARRVEVVN